MPALPYELSATITQYVKDVVDNQMRNRALFAFMNSAGLFEWNQSGKDREWRVKMYEVEAQEYDSASNPAYAANDRYKIARINWKAYQLGESRNKLEVERNKGGEAIINLVTDMVKSTTEDFKKSVVKRFYNNAVVNPKGYDGTETFLTAHATNVGGGNRCRIPDGTYAGIDTDPQAYGGTWSGDWPIGKGSVDYDFWSPLLIDTTGTGWGANPSFAAYPNEQLRFGIMLASERTEKGGQPLNVIMMPAEKKYEFMNAYNPSERVMMTATVPNLNAGFSIVSFDGVNIVTDFDLPTNTIYGFNIQQIKYLSIYPDLALPHGPLLLQDGSKTIFGIWSHGNLEFNPRGWVKWYPYT